MLPSERATEVVNQRQGEYGHPGDVYSVVAPMWGAILDCEVSAEQVGMCMVALKLGREAVQHQPDNLTDIAGYANVVSMIRDYNAAPKEFPG